MFSYDSTESLSSPLFAAKIKIYGDVDINLFVTDADGKKFKNSDLKITELYFEGDVNVNYKIGMHGQSKQQINIAFIKKPLIEILNGKYRRTFPANKLFDDQALHPLDWLESVIEIIAEDRGMNNVISLKIASPYD